MLSNCRIFEIESFLDKRGALSYLQKGHGVPFPIERVYYLYNTKAKHIRGIHAHKKLEQIIFAVSGKFEIKLDDGESSKIIILDKPNKGLYVSPMIWRELTPLEDNGVCIVLASRKYEEDDYIHNYKEYLSLVG